MANTPEFIRENQDLFSKIRDDNSRVCSVSSIVDTINACLDVNLVDSIRNIRTPTLVIGGDEDAFTPTHHGMKIHECIPNAQMKIIAGGCHNLLVEKPVETYSIIKRFWMPYEI